MIFTADEYSVLVRVRDERVYCGIEEEPIYRWVESFGLIERTWISTSGNSFWRLTAAGREALSNPHCIGLGERTP